MALDIGALIAQLLSQQGPQAITLGGPPQQDTGILPPGMTVPPLVPRSLTPGSALPGAGPVEMVPPRLPAVSDARPRLLGTGIPDTLTGDPMRVPLGPPRPTLPPADSLMSGIRNMGELPQNAGVGPFTTETQPEPQNPGVQADPIVTGALAAQNARGPSAATPATPTGSPAQTALRQPGLFDYIDTALAGMAGGRPVLSTIGERFEGRNATYDALIQRGATPELARAITLNPGQFGTVLPSLFSPNTVIVNNRLLDRSTGRLIADYSDKFAAAPEGSTIYSQTTGQPVAGGPSLPKPPAGFEWVDPSDRSKGLRAIPGGPGTHVSSEAAGRLAMMENARRGLADARRVYERAWGGADAWRQFWANVPMVGDVGQLSGEVGQAQRNVRIAVESALRTMTGAAAPEQEVARYAEMFTPNIRDTVQSAKQKMDALDAFMKRSAEIATQGRTANPTVTSAAGAGAGDWTDIGGGVRIRERR